LIGNRGRKKEVRMTERKRKWKKNRLREEEIKKKTKQE